MPCLAPLLTILLALPAGSTGVLKLQSQPGVEILWDGVALGTTDARGNLIIKRIPPGEYRLTLRKQGFHDLNTGIEVEEGEGSSRELLLRPLSAPGGDRARPEKQVDESRLAGREPGSPEPAEESAGDHSPLPGSSAAVAGPTPARSATTPSFPAFLGVAALLLALLSGAAGARLLSSRRKALALSQTPSPRAPGLPSDDNEIPVFEDADRGSPVFLEDLKRRERNLGDGPGTIPKRPEETIIEVEAVEVRPAGAQAADKAR